MAGACKRSTTRACYVNAIPAVIYLQRWRGQCWTLNAHDADDTPFNKTCLKLMVIFLPHYSWSYFTVKVIGQHSERCFVDYHTMANRYFCEKQGVSERCSGWIYFGGNTRFRTNPAANRLITTLLLRRPRYLHPSKGANPRRTQTRPPLISKDKGLRRASMYSNVCRSYHCIGGLPLYRGFINVFGFDDKLFILLKLPAPITATR